VSAKQIYLADNPRSWVCRVEGRPLRRSIRQGGLANASPPHFYQAKPYQGGISASSTCQWSAARRCRELRSSGDISGIMSLLKIVRGETAPGFAGQGSRGIERLSCGVPTPPAAITSCASRRRTFHKCNECERSAPRRGVKMVASRAGIQAVPRH